MSSHSGTRTINMHCMDYIILKVDEINNRRYNHIAFLQAHAPKRCKNATIMTSKFMPLGRELDVRNKDSTVRNMSQSFDLAVGRPIIR